MSKIILQGEKERRMNIWYEFDRGEPPVGEGGMGIVYRGELVDGNYGTSREIAIKEIKEQPEPAMSALVERSRREASIMLHNDNLVEMISFLQTEENFLGIKKYRYYVVSELLHGVTLDKVLSGKDLKDFTGQEVPFAKELYLRYTQNREETACYIVKRVSAGIMALHDEGYIHRDIDPSNIMVTTDGKIKLIDFGIAKKKTKVDVRDKALTSAGQFVGKAEYASPELVLGDIAHQDFTTDIYAVGILFFFLLTGELPFKGTRLEILNDQRFTKPPLNKIKDPRYRAIVGKAMEKIQSKRYQNISAFRVALDEQKSQFPFKPVIIGTASAVAIVLSFLIIRNLPEKKEPVVIDDPALSIESVVISDDNSLFSEQDSLITLYRFGNLDDCDIQSLIDKLNEDSFNSVSLFCAAMYVDRRGWGKGDALSIKSFYDSMVAPQYQAKYIVKGHNPTRKRCAYVMACTALEHLGDSAFSPDVKATITDYVSRTYNDKELSGQLNRYPDIP